MTPLEAYEAGLCTVVSTIRKSCENDWISRNGTCYDDSCCTSFETATSLPFRLAQFSHVFFSAIGIILVVLYSWKYSGKHMLPVNVRVLINIMLLLIVTHSLDLALFHIYHIIRSFLVSPDEPCSVKQTVSTCAPFRYTYTFCILSLAVCMYCIYIDRLLCAFYKNYLKHQMGILIAQIIQLLLISICTVAWVFRNENPNEYILSCMNTGRASETDVLIASSVVLPLNFICFFLSIWMFRVFKKREKGFVFTQRFSAAVDVESSEFLCMTTGTQSVLLVLFSFATIASSVTFYSFPRPVSVTLGTLSYTFNIYSTVVPWVMIRYARNTSENRKTRISSHVGLKAMGAEGAANYFGMMKSQWG